jgi:hypothetical protein
MHYITETHLIRTSTTLARKQSVRFIGSKPQTKLKHRGENILILKQSLGECIILNEFK